MEEPRYRSWDIAIKILGVIGAVGAAMWAAFTYMDTREIEFRKPFWDHQLALYFEATSAAAKMASLPSGKQRDEATASFWSLYYGPMVVVEDSENVAKTMVSFGRCFPK